MSNTLMQSGPFDIMKQLGINVLQYYNIYTAENLQYLTTEERKFQNSLEKLQ